MKNRKLFYSVLAAMFAALTAVCTAFVKIPFGVGGYVHLGDTLIYLAASLLPLPYAAVAAAIGGGMGDILSGYAMWAPFSLVIKALLTLLFTSKRTKAVCRRNVLACAAGMPITVIGYYIAESILYGYRGALASMPWNLLQAAASAVLFFIVGSALDKTGLRQRVFK